MAIILCVIFNKSYPPVFKYVKEQINTIHIMAIAMCKLVIRAYQTNRHHLFGYRNIWAVLAGALKYQVYIVMIKYAVLCAIAHRMAQFYSA